MWTNSGLGSLHFQLTGRLAPSRWLGRECHGTKHARHPRSSQLPAMAGFCSPHITVLAVLGVTRSTQMAQSAINCIGSRQRLEHTACSCLHAVASQSRRRSLAVTPFLRREMRFIASGSTHLLVALAMPVLLKHHRHHQEGTWPASARGRGTSCSTHRYHSCTHQMKMAIR